EATAAKRSHEFSPTIQPLDVDLPFAPAKKFGVERKRFWIFVLQHRGSLFFVPLMLSCQDGRTQHVEKPVHPGLHLFPVLPERMMQTGRKLDRDLMRRRHDQRPGY